MRRFFCHCGQEVFFDNTYCNRCNSILGFDPEQQKLISIEPDKGQFRSVKSPEKHYKRCMHHQHQMQCNWLLSIDDHFTQCLSCRLTRVIPNQAYPYNVKRWAVLEAAKRRMIYSLLRLGLPIDQWPAEASQTIQFHFLEDQLSNPHDGQEQVLSGHAGGIITLNASEADSSYREATREAMNEPYRTLLGHFRHEIGHFYWEKLIKDQSLYSDFKAIFGDDTVDYSQALTTYYETGPPEDFQQQYISAYASAHALEDWAETWAHYLLMHETLETAVAFDVIRQPESDREFSLWLSEWMELVVVLNALNRSIGNADAYPFVISATVQKKLQFIHDLVHR